MKDKDLENKAPNPSVGARSRMHPAIHGPLSARVALLQSPILSAQPNYDQKHGHKAKGNFERLLVLNLKRKLL
jgi:hypothetical protein